MPAQIYQQSLIQYFGRAKINVVNMKNWKYSSQVMIVAIYAITNCLANNIIALSLYIGFITMPIIRINWYQKMFLYYLLILLLFEYVFWQKKIVTGLKCFWKFHSWTTAQFCGRDVAEQPTVMLGMNATSVKLLLFILLCAIWKKLIKLGSIFFLFI